MTKVAAMPIYGKHEKFFFSGTKEPMTLKVCMLHWVLKCYQVCSNEDSGLTLTYFTARSNLVSYAFVWEKVKTMDFAETIVVYDVKVVRCSNLNKYLKLYEYQRSRSLTDLGPNLSDIFKVLFLNRPIEAKFHVEPPLDGKTKAYSNVLGHMTRMVAMPIYGKIIEDIFLWYRKADDLETWYTALSTRLLPFFVFSNNAPWVDLNLFYDKVKYGPLCFCIGKS